MERFVSRENIQHLRYELENGAEPMRRATMLKLLCEEEDHFGRTHEAIGKLDRRISRLAEIIAGQVELTDRLRGLGDGVERAEMVLATLNDLMACYVGYRRQLDASV